MICHVSWCLAEDICHPLELVWHSRTVLRTICMALVLFPWVGQVWDPRYPSASTALPRWAEELTCEIQESPRGPEEQCAHVPALLPGPP